MCPVITRCGPCRVRTLLLEKYGFLFQPSVGYCQPERSSCRVADVSGAGSLGLVHGRCDVCMRRVVTRRTRS
ncbi:MAG: hypothetical protein [Microvirus sp.]|nr:MAG: hypothetical protein [Microvirus sp.]